MELTIDTYKREIAEAVKVYDKYIVCLDKTPDECEAIILSLMKKAINAYVKRAPNLRHGIAVDKHLTVILSQTEDSHPLCGIYFNLHTPYSNMLKAAK